MDFSREIIYSRTSESSVINENIGIPHRHLADSGFNTAS